MQVDLEDLAAGYAHRPASTAGLARAEQAAQSVGLAAGNVALDVGGGRGAHAAVWARRGAQAVVVDPSSGMTHEAVKRPGVAAVRATSQRLPIAASTVSLVYFHLSLHYGDWKAALSEAHRVLFVGGECWVWTMGEHHHRASFLARWFPSVGYIDTARFPDPSAVAARFESNWRQVTTGREVEHKVSRVGQWRAAAEARFVSTLQLIPDDEFRAGLQAYDKTYPDSDELIEYQLTYDWIRARK